MYLTIDLIYFINSIVRSEKHPTTATSGPVDNRLNPYFYFELRRRGTFDVYGVNLDRLFQFAKINHLSLVVFDACVCVCACL